MIENINDFLQPGQTPLSEIEIDGLIPLLTYKRELDRAEAENIIQARTWVYARKRKFSSEQILKSNWLKQLHKKMFDEVWEWAGSYRTTNKNIGVSAYLIPTEVESMLVETSHRLENKDDWGYTNQQIALLLSHKSVQIHPFANGNGRWSRDLADAFLDSLGEKPFTWGSSLPSEKQHDAMIRAIKAADVGDFENLMKFAIS